MAEPHWRSIRRLALAQMPLTHLQDWHWSLKLQSEPPMAEPHLCGAAKAVRVKARVTARVKNRTILIEVLVVLGELSRFK